MAENLEQSEWLAVIARTLAFLGLVEADLRGKPLADQAKFLDALGMPRRDSAQLLGTSEASLRELIRQAAKSKDKTHGKKKQKR